MEKSIRPVFFTLILLIMFLTGCAPAPVPVQPTFTPMPTNTPAPTSTPAPTQTPSENVFTQTFDNSEGSFDSSIWICSAGSCNAQNVFQKNGMLVFNFNNSDVSSGIWGAFMKSQATWKMVNLISLEGNLQISEKTKGGTWLGLNSSSACSIQVKPNSNTPIIHCDLSFNGNTEYTTSDIPVEFNTWYLIRIDYDPITKEQSYYLDNKFIGQYTQINSPDSTSIAIGTWREQNRSVDAYIDNVVVRSRP